MLFNLHISIKCYKFAIAKFDDVNSMFSFAHRFFSSFLLVFTYC